MQIVDSQVKVVGYSSPAIESAVILLSCPPGHKLTGSNSTTSTCMGNGEWEPDLREVECKGKSMIS